MVYSDDTHIPNENEIKNEIAKYPPDEMSKLLAKWMREKKFGVDTREAMALNIELNGGKTANVTTRQDKVENQFEKVIANATVDSELILARESDEYGKFPNLDARLENLDSSVSLNTKVNEEQDEKLTSAQLHKVTTDSGASLPFINNTDLNTLNTAASVGQYDVNGTTVATTPNLPALTATTAYGHLTVVISQSGTLQTYTPNDLSATYKRVYDVTTSAWSPWQPYGLDSGWISCPMLNGMSGTAKIRKVDNVVSLSAALSVTANFSGKDVFSIPTGFQPDQLINLIGSQPMNKDGVSLGMAITASKPNVAHVTWSNAATSANLYAVTATWLVRRG